MENANVEIDGNTMTITIDLSVNLGLSKSQKSQVIATSRGNAKIPGTDVICGLNVYRKA